MSDSCTFSDIEIAYKRIKPFIQHTPVLQSALLNQWLGHNIYFKAECLQTTGAFKLRGATNFIAKLAEKNTLPNTFIANSSGNHAQAVAYAARHFKVPACIYSASNISSVKAAATQHYGAQLKLFENRTLADQAVFEESQREGVIWIPPFNHPDIIAGQGTATYEALKQVDNIDAVFAPCGGGGLVSGSKICAKAINKDIAVIGAEPLAANDAAQSIRQGHIVSLSKSPNTLADGAATPSVGEHTFPHLQALDGFYEINEADIVYWTQWLQHLLKLHIEPTCAMTMQAVIEWTKEQKPSTRQNYLVIISGGNISAQSMAKVWEKNCLDSSPSLSV